jgi:hypothetical protein
MRKRSPLLFHGNKTAEEGGMNFFGDFFTKIRLADSFFLCNFPVMELYYKFGTSILLGKEKNK